MKGGRVLVVDDEPTMADGLRLVLEAEGHTVVTAGTVADAVQATNGHGFHLAILDLVLPDGDGLSLLRDLKRRDSAMEVIMITAHGSIPKAVEAIKDGAFYFVAKPFNPEEITALAGKALERRLLVAEATDLKRRLAKTSGYAEILGSAPPMHRVFELMDAVANSDANVLIVGESGTGKELVADAIHARSPRSEGPWVKINCAALPKDLIESELFGHVKGAFTGAATDKVGLLEEAHRGSLLLDEITEMPLDLQAKLLRVLEERTVRRIGGSRTITVDFRLITSSNRPAEQAITEGRLRQDLYFRINTVTISLPPLRERTGDIPLLARHYLERFATNHGRAVETISPEAYRRMLAHPWPGNVRELEHAIERAVLVTRTPEIGMAELPESLGTTSEILTNSGAPPGSLEEIERASILRALESTNWNKQAAAALLGLRRPTLYSKMRKHGIPQRRT